MVDQHSAHFVLIWWSKVVTLQQRHEVLQQRGMVNDAKEVRRVMEAET